MIGECLLAPQNLLLKSRLDSPLLINGALLRHDAPFTFIGYSAATELSGYTFTDRSEKRQCLCDRYRPPANRVCLSGAAVRKVSFKEREEESGQHSVSVVGGVGAVGLSERTEDVRRDLYSCDAETGFHSPARLLLSLFMAPGALHRTQG